MTEMEKYFDECLEHNKEYYTKDEVVELYNLGQTNKEEAVIRFNNFSKKKQARWCHLYVAYASLLRERGVLKD